jgi:hypothetical protein
MQSSLCCDLTRNGAGLVSHVAPLEACFMIRFMGFLGTLRARDEYITMTKSSMTPFLPGMKWWLDVHNPFPGNGSLPNP